MKKLLLGALPVLVVCGYLTSVRSATVDPVVYWNGVAEAAFARAVAAGRPGQVGGLDFAMVHVAVHDAVQAFEKRFSPYHSEIPRPSGGSPAAAVAKAAHDVLVNLYPAQETAAGGLNAIYDSYLASNGLAANDAGVFVGQHAAAGIINLRALDGRFPPLDPRPCGPSVGENCIFRGGTAPGEWRPTESFNLPPGALPPTLPGPPPSNAPMAVVWLGKVTPFTLTSPLQFRAEPPPSLTSREYTRAYNEVKALGSLTSTSRTTEQTDLSYFYADNFVLLWNRAVNKIAAEHVHAIGDNARLFALVYLAAADSGITAWDSKKHFDFWRPLTAIREGDNDGNPRTAGDANWKPLINTPNYPDYTSGANNLTGAVTRMLSLFFRTEKMTFTVNSNYPLAQVKTRVYSRFSDAAQDVVNVRIYQGIHFRFADTAARRQGSQVAKWVYKHSLRPLHDDDDDDDDAAADDQDRGERDR
jgi:hypothetical protein